MRQKWVSWSGFLTIAGPKEPTSTTEHPNKCIGAATFRENGQFGFENETFASIFEIFGVRKLTRPGTKIDLPESIFLLFPIFFDILIAQSHAVRLVEPP